ncbi:MAG: DNA-binding response regulator [Rhodobacterales bacterium 17-64-5]|nr:MAG: DNA-binding response regulator [Rhodobacterales bacterium 17-64-5]
MTQPPHILIVDDNRDIRDALVKYLEKNGMRATSAANAVAMDAAMKVGQFDLIVLDVMMPGEDGLSVCRRLRAQGAIPILMLTALGDETDRIVGLEVGADDYLPKPFNPRELLARIKAILRRSDRGGVVGGSLAGHRLAFDRWVLDSDRRTLTDADGIEVALTTAEFRLLCAFLDHPGLVLSRDQLLDLTVGRAADPFDRSIDNQVSRLRKKIEADPKSPALIKTHWGGGYSLVAEVAS